MAVSSDLLGYVTTAFNLPYLAKTALRTQGNPFDSRKKNPRRGLPGIFDEEPQFGRLLRT